MAFTPQSESDFLVSVEDWGLFAQSSEITVAGESTDSFDGGAKVPYTLGGRATGGDFTVMRPFDRGREMGRYSKYLPQVNGVYLAVTIMPTDTDLQRSGPYFSARCLLKGIVIPATNNGSRGGAPNVPNVTLTLRGPAWAVRS